MPSNWFWHFDAFVNLVSDILMSLILTYTSKTAVFNLNAEMMVRMALSDIVKWVRRGVLGEKLIKIKK